MLDTAEAEFPGLFRHRNRADWGVGVLSGERDGKRTYLFEGGEERIMGQGSLDMMTRLTSLDADQRNTLARLTALVARRHGLPDSSSGSGLPLLTQIATLRRTFAEGLADPAWQSEHRAGQVRETIAPRARQVLAIGTLDARLKAQQYEELWNDAAEVLGATGWVPAAQLAPAAVMGLGLLANALRELLYGSAALEQRVDRFSVAFETAFRRPTRWETTTGLLSLVFPSDHVLVDLASFRKQLKLLGSKGTLPQSPNGQSYVRCLNTARIIASKLAEQGEVPRDLLDVHDFIRFTLKPAAPARRPKAAKATKKPTRDADVDDSAAED
jgi:hypothetical protein